MFILYLLCKIDDNRGNITIGSMICYDQEFFESARVLSSFKNVEIIIKPNACEFDQGSHWRLRSKAIENFVGIIMANYPSPVQPLMNGNSCAYNWNGDTIVVANETEQIVYATFNVTAIREARYKYLDAHFPLQNVKLCDFRRQSTFMSNNVYYRVSGSTV